MTKAILNSMLILAALAAFGLIAYGFFLARGTRLRHRTASELDKVAHDIEEFTRNNRQYPQGDIRQAIGDIELVSGLTIPQSPDIEKGCDAWGTPLRYEIINQKEALLWSLGPNGIDEHGRGDDMLRELRNQAIRLPVQDR